MESVLNTTKGICYKCGAWKPTHLHHIIHASVSKKTQERMGLVVYLCWDCHEGTNGVHGKKGGQYDQNLKKEAQEAWEKKYIESYPYENHARQAAREEWMQNIHRNYILEEEQYD